MNIVHLSENAQTTLIESKTYSCISYLSKKTIQLDLIGGK